MIWAALVHEWHWLYRQIQLDNWFGNIVAGVVAFLIMDVAWRWKIKGWANEVLHRHFHHHREIQAEKADERHADLTQLVEDLHRKVDAMSERIDALR